MRTKQTVLADIIAAGKASEQLYAEREGLTIGEYNRRRLELNNKVAKLYTEYEEVTKDEPKQKIG